MTKDGKGREIRVAAGHLCQNNQEVVVIDVLKWSAGARAIWPASRVPGVRASWSFGRCFGPVPKCSAVPIDQPESSVCSCPFILARDFLSNFQSDYDRYSFRFLIIVGRFNALTSKGLVDRIFRIFELQIFFLVKKQRERERVFFFPVL